MGIKFSFIAFAAAALAPLAHSSPVAAQETSPSVVSALAEEFGRLYMPTELGIEGAVAGFDKEFYPAIRADANVAALDKAKPGLIDAAGKAASSVMTSAIRRDIPNAQLAIATYADANFSAEELTVLNAFLASPTGLRVQRLALEGADTSAVAEAVREGGEVPKLDGAQLLAMVDPGIITKLSKDEIADLVRFGISPAGKKFDAHTARMSELVASEMNKIVEAMQPDIEKAIVEVFATHLGQK